MSVLVATSLGEFVIDLFADRCPLTCKNFLKLCKIKYYNGCLFHMVQKDFTAQTGDPSGTGNGGDSIYKFLYGDQARFFSDEIHPDLKHSKMGTVAMASAGENLNASQFYITLRHDIDSLDEKHTVFGEVAEGLDTLTRLNDAYVDENGRPFKNIRIKHTYVLDDPFEDPPQLTELIPVASPDGRPEVEVDDDVRLEDDWEPMDEQLAPEDLDEVIRTKEAHSRAVVLESIGDIPDADVKPPENVLFVCKLNPVTEDEDLHTIFSRFGTVTSAEVIRDAKTGDSLCYAFIEFESNDACERAYFKMGNALIDDRRIKVDFSQSVSKLWNQFRRKGKQGRGCFKCGELDHIARDCSMGSNNPGSQQQKFVLKHENQQHGDKDSGYEMVFDEKNGSPHPKKLHRDYEQPDRKKYKSERSGHDDDNHKSNENRDSRDRERRQFKYDEQEERENSHGRRDDTRRGSRYGSRSDGREKESSPGRDDKRKGRRHRDKSTDRERANRLGGDDRREVTYRGRSDRDHREQKNDVEYRNKAAEIDRQNNRDDPSRKKDADTDRDISRRDNHHRKNDEEYRNKAAATDRRDKHDEPHTKRDVETERDRSRQEDDYRGKNDEDYRKKAVQNDRRDKRDEPSRKRDTESRSRQDDHHHGKARDQKDERRRRDRT